MELEKLVLMLVMYLNCAFEIFLLYNLLEGIFPVYEENRGIGFFKAIGCITVMFIINRFGLPGVNLIGIPLVFFFYIRMVFQMQFKYICLYVVLYYVITAVTEFTFYYIYQLMGIDVSIVGFARVIILIIQNIFRFMIVQVIKRRHQCSYERESYKYLKYLFILPFTTLIIINIFLFPVKYPISEILICIGGILLVVSNVVEFHMVETIIKEVNRARDAEILHIKTDLEQKHYHRLEEINEEYAKNIHELRRMVKTVEHLVCIGESNEANELANELVQKGYAEKRKTYIGDKIVNAVFVEREKIAEDMKVEYSVKIQPGLDLNFMNDTDKITVFGNLLDNALEAAAGSKGGYVNVDLYMGNHCMLIFRVKNNFKNVPRKNGKRYLTLKQIKNEHGFGIKLVEDLARKYNGTLNIKEDMGTFIVMLFLSNIPITEI